MEKNNATEIINFVNNFKGNAIVSIDYVSSIRMNKGGRSQSNTLYGHDVVRYNRTQLQIGNIYENSVNNRSEKECGERTFETEEMKGFKWVRFPYILTNTNETQLYVRFYKMKNAHKESYVVVDGHIANDDEMAVIKEYEVKSNYFSAKQAENGLTENQVKPFNIKVENILRLSVNGVEIVGEKMQEYAKVLAVATA